MTETPFTGHEGKYVSMPPRNVVPKPVQKPHPPLWVACSRRDTILLAAEKGIGALSSPSSTPRRPSSWVGDYERTMAETLRARRPGRQPQGRLRDADDVPPRRGRRPSSGASRAATSSATRSPTTTCSASTSRRRPTCGRSSRSAATSMGYSPEAAIAARQRDARRQDRRRRHHRPARRGRHARPDPRVPAPLRGGRRRPDHLRDAGGPEPPRAHHGVARAVRHRGAARVHRARRRRARRPRPSASPRSSRRPWPARSTTRAADARRLRHEGHPQADGRRHGERAGPGSGSTRWPSAPPPATRDDDLPAHASSGS